MKKAKIWIPPSLVFITIISTFWFGWFLTNIKSDFATEIFLEYHYGDKNISVKLTDENDILTLKQILTGCPFKDNPACGFTTEISITMTDRSKSIVFCPANDGCPLLRIDDSGKYIKISDEARISMNEVLEKYGMTFPCV